MMGPLDAEILATGDELLSGAVVDRNGAFASEVLREHGVVVRRMTIVGDGEDQIEAALREAVARCQVVVVSGGLGPTEDDRTSAAVAAMAGVPLSRSEAALAHLHGFFRKRGVTFSVNNEKQADLPEGAAILDNPIGTAVGFTVTVGNAQVFCLPGVPMEYRKMLVEQVVTRIDSRPEARLVVRVLRLYGIPESQLEMDLKGLELPSSVSVGYRATWPELHLRLYAEGARELEPDLDLAEEAIRSRVGHRIYGTGDKTLPEVVGTLLLDRGWRLAAAESCTGGLLGATVTEIPGSSRWFDRGFVTYSNESKVALLGVGSAILEEYGAVSQQTAEAMALGARERSDADIAVSITGIAGPDGGTEEKPVGTVWLGLSTESMLWSRMYSFHGGRRRIRQTTVWRALDRIRRAASES